MLLFLDTETSGFYQAHLPLDHPTQGRLVELAAILYSDQFEEIGRVHNIVKPNGFEISEQVARIHGITQERALEEGIELEDCLLKLTELIHKPAHCEEGFSRVIAHNLRFDHAIIQSEYHRTSGAPSQLFGMLSPFCTMIALTEIMKLPSKPGHGRTGRGYKWPKLGEAYQWAFGEELVGAHSALVDTEALVRLYQHCIANDHFRPNGKWARQQ